MIQQIREEAAASQSTTHYIEFDVSSQVKREMGKPNKNLWSKAKKKEVGDEGAGPWKFQDRWQSRKDAPNKADSLWMTPVVDCPRKKKEDI